MRPIPDPAFAGDDGAADPALTVALSAHALDGRLAPVLVALSQARLVVPVVAMPAKSGTNAQGEVVGKPTDMAAVLLTGRDGRRALLAFTGKEAMAAWDTSARPVPVTTAQAAQAALGERASALVVDVAGPVRLVVEGDDLLRLGAGERLVPLGAGWAWSPDVQTPPTGW